MASNKKFLKSLLTTASALAVMAGASNAGAAAVNITGNAFNLATGANANGVVGNGDSVTYTGDFTGITGTLGGITIAKIVTAATTPGILTVVNDAGAAGTNVTISKVTTGAGGLLPISLFNASELTLDGAGNLYAGLGSIDGDQVGDGTVILTGNGLIYNGTIGATKQVALVKINAGGNAVTLGGAVVAASVTFVDNSTLNLNNMLTGDIDFANQAGTVVVANNKTITGAVDSNGGANGTLRFAGIGTVTQAIGANGALLLIDANGAGAVNLGNGNAVNATTIRISNANAVVTAAGDVNGAVVFTAAGTYNSSNLTGDIDFANQAGTVVVANNKTITGAVDSNGGANGTLKFAGAGTVTGIIGANNALTKIQLLGAGVVDLQAAVTATDITFGAAGTLRLRGNTTSNIDFVNNAGTVVVANGVTITGAVDSTVGGPNGTLRFQGVGTVTQAIGANNALLLIDANGAGVVNLGNGNAVNATTIRVSHPNAIVTAAGDVNGAVAFTAAGTYNTSNLTGNINFANKAATVEVADTKIITGAVDSTGGPNGTLRFVGQGGVTLAVGGTNALTLVQLNGDGGLGAAKLVTFGGLLKAATLDLAGAKTKAQLDTGALIDTLTIANANSSVNIANANTLEFTGTNNAINLAGNNGKITFGGNDAVLKLNSTAGIAVTATFGALNPGAGDTGKIILHANGAGSTLTINGGVLGQVGANTLRAITVTGNQLVTLNSAIGSQLLEVDNGAKLLATNPTAGRSVLTTIGALSELEYRPTANMQIAATNFANANSVLKLTANGADRTFTLLNDIDPGGNGQGIVILHGDGNQATLTGNGGVKVLGNGNNIAEVRATGGASQISALVDITNVDLLTVDNGATLNSLTNTAFDIAQTNIGAVGGGGTLILDSQGAAAIDVLDAGKALSFEHANSLLKLTNVDGNANATFKLKTNLAPGGGVDLKGNLEINATNAQTITITKQVGQTIGTSNIVRLGSLLISGDQAVTIDTGVFAKNITISSTANVTLGAVDSGVGDATKIQFTADGGVLEFAGNVTTKTIDINTKTRTITVANGMDLNLDDITNGANSQMTFLGNGNLNLFAGKTVNLGKIIAGANATTVILGQGTYTGEVRAAHAGGTVKLSDGFNLTGGFNTTGGAAGIVKFLGNSSVSGALGTAGNALGAVTVAGAGTTLQVGGEIAVASLDGTGAGNQNLKFINAGNLTVVGNVGANTQFTEIEFNGAHEVDFNNLKSTNGKTLNFTAAAKVITTGYDLGTTDIQGVAGGKLTIDIDQNITGDITNFGTLKISGDKIVNINTAKFAANIETKVGGEGTVNFNIAGADVISVGGGGAKVKALNFSAAKAIGAVHADNISILANGNARFTDVIDTNQIKFTTAATSIANFGAGNLTTLLVSDGGTGKGIANFAGTGIQVDVGAAGARLAQANFAAGQVSAINANIYVDAINVDGTITMTRAATFDGASTFKAATIALGPNDLTFNNGNVVFNGNSIISTTITRVDLGNLVSEAGSNITINGNLDVQVDALAAIPVNGQRVTLIKKGGGTLNLNINNITVTKNGGAFAHWRQEIAPDGSLILTNASQIAEDSNDAAASVNYSKIVTSEISQAFEDFVPGTQGEDVLSVFNTFIAPDGSRDKFAIADGEARLAYTTANEVVGATFEAVSTMTDQINGRMFDVGSVALSFAPAPDVSNVGQSQGASFTPAGNQPASGGTPSSPAAGGGSGGSSSTNVDAPAAKTKSTKVSANEFSGIAAGDQSDRYGIWATPFYSKSTQKQRGSSSGYKSDGYGGTFGFDTRANEEMIVGLAVTAMNSDIKHKDFKSGDKTKVGTILFSAYSNYQFGNNWFGQGVFSIGSSNVTNKEKRRISTTNYTIASAEYSSMTFASEVLGGYNHLVNNQLVLTPMFGLGYSRINDSSYQETGNGPQLLSVTKRASQKVELVGGLRVTGLPFIVGEVSLTPEMHGSVRHDVIGKGARVDAKIPGLPNLPSEKVKLQKTYYGLGASLKASYGMMDYGVAADTMFAKKYVGVNGSVNVRVNF